MVGHRRQRDEQRPRDVAAAVLVGLAHVDQPGAGGERGRRAGRRRSRDCHGAKVPSAPPRRPTGRSGVLTLRSDAASTATGDRPHRATARAAPARRRPSAARRAGAAAAAPPREALAAGDRSGPRRRRRPAPRRPPSSSARTRRRRATAGRRRDDHDVVVGRGVQRGEHAAGGTLARASRRRARGRPSRASSDARRRRRARPARSPAASSARGDALGHRHAVDLDERLVGAHPAAGAAAQHGAGGHDACGGPSGSSCTRNIATRSASSCSPIAAAIAPSPASARRKPRLVGSDQRT